LSYWANTTAVGKEFVADPVVSGDPLTAQILPHLLPELALEQTWAGATDGTLFDGASSFVVALAGFSGFY